MQRRIRTEAEYYWKSSHPTQQKQNPSQGFGVAEIESFFSI